MIGLAVAQDNSVNRPAQQEPGGSERSPRRDGAEDLFSGLLSGMLPVLQSGADRALTQARLANDDFRVIEPSGADGAGSRTGTDGRVSALDVRLGEQGKGTQSHLFRPMPASSSPAPAPDPTQSAPATAGAELRSAERPDVRAANGPAAPEVIGRDGYPVQRPDGAPSPLASTQTATAAGAETPSWSPPAGVPAGVTRPAGLGDRPTPMAQSPVAIPRTAPVLEGPGAEVNRGDVDSGLQSGTRKANQRVPGLRSSAGQLPQETRLRTVRDVLRVLRANLGQRHSTVRLQLQPPELGKLTIDMKLENDRLQLKIEAEHDQVRELLNSRSSVLSRALLEQGLTVDRYEVVLAESDPAPTEFEDPSGDDARGAAARHDASEGQEQTGREPEESQASATDAEPEESSGRLDIRA